MAQEKEKEVLQLTDVTVRFAGDSGDGMQLTGSQFGDTTALFGNDLNTFPDYPAEIRAPIGTLYGVSGYQLHFSSSSVHTPGDAPDVLVAMNPAALKRNMNDLKRDGIIIVNTDSFDAKNLKLANFTSNPLEDDSLSNFKVYPVPITTLTSAALKDSPLSLKDVTRCKNFFALGLMYWLFNMSMDQTLAWITRKFGKKPEIMHANEIALKAGYYFGDTAEIFENRYSVQPAKLPKGTYRNISGNEATALGLIAASQKSGLPLYLGSYPITPATEILHYLSAYKYIGVKTFQAEDEIAGICSAIGASFAGNLAVTTTSGPGLALKTEAIGLAVMTELPLVIIDVQRGGPSTGLPTKPEQSDLLQAIYGRNGEAPVPVIAASTPADCFTMAIEACRIATKYMTPVILLSDGFIGQGTEPWKVPNVNELPEFKVKFRTEKEGFQPYSRDENLSRPWVRLGTPGLEHRIGGLEKQHLTGNVCTEPDNHDFMVHMRADKVKKVADDIPELKICGDEDSEILVIGWGGTYGAITEAVKRLREKGTKVAQAHLNYLFPMPKNTRNELSKFKTILVPEINLGQLSLLIRNEFLIPVEQLNIVRGLPLKSSDIEKKILELLGGKK
jgi:2-oxoglutarate ferredoxin oxidoreductase subunit alpha